VAEYWGVSVADSVSDGNGVRLTRIVGVIVFVSVTEGICEVAAGGTCVSVAVHWVVDSGEEVGLTCTVRE